MPVDDKEADFLDYIESLTKKEQREKNEARAARLRQEWRESTWAGATIAFVERIGAADFFAAVGNSFQGGDDSSSYYATKIVYKVGTIVGYIFFVYLLGRLLKMITGEEIVIEQEIVIVEEVTKSQLQAEERERRETANEMKKTEGSARHRRGKRS
ncbi:hypothetical protein ACHAXS_014195 [Conticribra weissflogii]